MGYPKKGQAEPRRGSGRRDEIPIKYPQQPVVKLAIAGVVYVDAVRLFV